MDVKGDKSSYNS